MKLRKSVALATALVIAIGALACNRSSPTRTLNAFIEAVRKKDNEAIKKTLSKDALKKFEDIGKTMNKSLDETITIFFGKFATNAKMPETRNEKIEGDTATLELKEENSDKWLTMPFVKEDGEWKIALDKAK